LPHCCALDKALYKRFNWKNLTGKVQNGQKVSADLS